MKIDRINLQILFPTGIYMNVRAGMEATIQNGEDIEQSLTQLKTRIEDWFAKNYPNVGEVVTYSNHIQPATTADSRELATQRMISSIDSCTDIKVLETFKLLARNNPEFQLAYDKKLKQLQDV